MNVCISSAIWNGSSFWSSDSDCSLFERWCWWRRRTSLKGGQLDGQSSCLMSSSSGLIGGGQDLSLEAHFRRRDITEMRTGDCVLFYLYLWALMTNVRKLNLYCTRILCPSPALSPMCVVVATMVSNFLKYFSFNAICFAVCHRCWIERMCRVVEFEKFGERILMLHLFFIKVIKI